VDVTAPDTNPAPGARPHAPASAQMGSNSAPMAHPNILPIILCPSGDATGVKDG
jgi:hypothetical protein